MLVLACPTRLSCAGAQPQEPGYRLCSQNLRLSSRIFFGSDCQLTGRGSNLDSNLNLPPGQRDVKVLSAPKSVNNLCGVRILFSSVQSAEIEGSCESIPNFILQTELRKVRRRRDSDGLPRGSQWRLWPGAWPFLQVPFQNIHRIIMKSGPGNDEIQVSHRKKLILPVRQASADELDSDVIVLLVSSSSRDVLSKSAMA